MTQDLPAVRYGVGGGSPPPSAELLTIDGSGAATYLTGHPWPLQPPFDEIGTYAAALGGDRVSELGSLLDALRGRSGEIRAAPGFTDAGLESLTVDWGPEQIDLVWSPPRKPAPLEALVSALRQVIADLRENPVSVLRATREDGRLRLENRGAEPFTLHPLGAGALAELWIGSEPAAGPPELYVGEPLAVPTPEGGTGDVVIDAGAAVTAAAPETLRAEADALLHVAWTAAGPGALPEAQPGWLLLAAAC